MRRLVLTVAGIAAIYFGGASSVLAHEVSGSDVDCDGRTITVSGIKFAEDLPRLVTVTGPGVYLETFEVTTDSWSHAFPLGPNGHYQVDWPNSGDFGPVPFLVDCATAEPTPTPRPTPSAAGHTLRPNPTPPQTDTVTSWREPMFDWIQLGWLALIFLGITGLVERYLDRRARR